MSNFTAVVDNGKQFSFAAMSDSVAALESELRRILSVAFEMEVNVYTVVSVICFDARYEGPFGLVYISGVINR